MGLIDHLRRYRHKKLVRPWALSAPILVLVVALPMLRPLRHPDPLRLSDEESARLATVQAIVEQKTLSIRWTDFSGTHRKFEHGGELYSDQPPMMAAMLSVAYRVMYRSGLNFAHDSAKVIYLLTLLGVTVPAACAAGLIYRMGRLFELKRPLRAALAASCVLGTGLLSYATVLNPHVPAATFVLASAACLVHLTIARRRPIVPVWLAASGACAAMAATIDQTALPFLFLFPAVVLAMRWRPTARLGGALLYAIGAIGPIVLHASLTLGVTGDFWQGGWKSASNRAAQVDPGGWGGSGLAQRPHADAVTTPSDDDDDESPAFWHATGRTMTRILAALVGEHGLLSHFPILVFGVAGGSMIMHRHWPSSAKVLAWATVAGAVFLVIAYGAHLKDGRQWRDAMFASRWFIVFGPLLLFWAGAWLRRPHRPWQWAIAGLALAFSLTVNLIGATNPLPANGFGEHYAYTAADALAEIIHPSQAAHAGTSVAEGR